MAKFNLKDFKESLEIANIPEKADKYVKLDECLQEVLGLPGLPLGDITEIHGDSDTGKTTILLHAAAECQKQGIMPVIIVTEKKWRDDRAAAMGLDIDNAIIQKGLNNIEDVFQFADKIVASVNKGKLPYDTMIFIDSLGNINSKEARKENKDGTTEIKNIHQKNAKVITENLMVMSDKVNDTRKETYNHLVGMVILNHIYEKASGVSYLPAIQQPRGGKKLKYVSSLMLSTKTIKKLKAVKDGNQVKFGIVTKITVEKNHLSNVSNSGEFVIASNAIIPNDAKAIEDYKKVNSEAWGSVDLIEEESE